MDFDTTLLWLIICAVILVISNVLGRKAEPLTMLSYIPWTGIQFTALVLMIVFGAHLYSEWRGVPLVGTRSPLRGL